MFNIFGCLPSLSLSLHIPHFLSYPFQYFSILLYLTLFLHPPQYSFFFFTIFSFSLLFLGDNHFFSGISTVDRIQMPKWRPTLCGMHKNKCWHTMQMDLVSALVHLPQFNSPPPKKVLSALGYQSNQMHLSRVSVDTTQQKRHYCTITPVLTTLCLIMYRQMVAKRQKTLLNWKKHYPHPPTNCQC